MTDRIGHVLVSRYRLVRELGSGGMGTVYLAEHVHLGRPTAVKLMHKELTLEPDAEQRFRREALLAAKISHSSVAQVYDFDCTPYGEFLLAMEYVEGETVAQRLKTSGPFPLALALQVLKEVAEGLDLAHGLGILHRDIKPENIMLAAGGVVKLLDFGVARAFETTSSITSAGFAVGTPAYMSPEQLMGESLGPASDLYALGTVFYEMLTGQPAHSGKSFAEFRAKRMSQPPTALHLLRPEIPTALTEVVARALDPEPRGRWPSATAFARAADDALKAAAPPAVGGSPRRSRVSAQLDRWQSHFAALRFAGREREMRMVRDAWAASRTGRTTLLWIEGDEGAGKSSFFEQAEREAAGDEAAQVTGRGYEADVVRPYGPWLPMLRRALQLRAAEGRAWPAIEALADAKLETRAPDRAVLYDEVTLLVGGAAERGPVLIGMEDLDWCDPASISLFEFLAHDISDVPLLLVTSSSVGRGTSEVRERMRRLENVVWVTLRPLGYEAVAAWLSRALGREAPEELVRFVYGHTEGNAFFIEQVVRSLIERGDMDRVTDELRVSFADVPPPEAVADVVQRRLKGMSAAAREILQIAAVVGREFDVDLLIKLSTRAEDAVLNALDEAVFAGVLSPLQRSQGDWYRFTHNKLGQVLAQAMNARRRRKLHGQIAEALAQHPDSPAGVMAWHWYHAGDFARASVAARVAARHALNVHDYDDAVTFAVMAAETGETAEEKGEAHELRGDALRRLDRNGEAAAAYARARLVGDVGPDIATNLRRKELRCALVAGTVSPVAAAAEAKKLAENAGALPPQKRTAVEIVLAEALTAAGEVPPAIEAAKRAQAAAEETGDRFQVGDALLALGHAELKARNLDEAVRAAREASVIFTEAADPYSSARAASLIGQVAAAASDLPAARAAFDDALRQAERAHVTRLVRQIKERQAELER
jgi:tetratricopeptide (TPR) repeat protein